MLETLKDKRAEAGAFENIRIIPALGLQKWAVSFFLLFSTNTFFLNPIFIKLHVQTTYDVGEPACLACSYL